MNTSNILQVKKTVSLTKLMKKKWKQQVPLLPPTLSLRLSRFMSATQTMLMQRSSLRWSDTKVISTHLKFESLCTT